MARPNETDILSKSTKIVLGINPALGKEDFHRVTNVSRVPIVDVDEWLFTVVWQ